MNGLERFLHDLDTTDLEEWGNLTKEIARFGKDATVTLCEELLKSIGNIKMPYAVLQLNPIVSLQEYNGLIQRFSELEEGTLNAKGAAVINVRCNKVIAENVSTIQDTISHKIIYAGEGADVHMATAEEIWVAPKRKVSYVYAGYIFAGFPPPPNFPKEAFYETDDPADGIMASGYNRAWGIIDALIRIGDKRAIPYLQTASEKAKSNSLIIYNAALECINKLK